MPKPNAAGRLRTPYAPALDLPPLFRLVTLARGGRCLRACAQRSRPSEGAGTLVWVGRFDLVEFALVLEPDEPLRSARRALYAGMAALADALAVACAAGEADRVRLAGRDPGRRRAGRRRPPRLAGRADEDEPPPGWCSAP